MSRMHLHGQIAVIPDLFECGEEDLPVDRAMSRGKMGVALSDTGIPGRYFLRR